MNEIEEMALIMCEYVKIQGMKKLYIMDCQNNKFLLISHNTGLAEALYNAGYRKTEVKTNGDFFRSISGTIPDEQFANDNVEVVRSVKGGELFIARVVGEVFSTKNEAYQANLEWLKKEYKGE